MMFETVRKIIKTSDIRNDKYIGFMRSMQAQHTQDECLLALPFLVIFIKNYFIAVKTPGKVCKTPD